MIDVKQIAKPKGGSGSGGSSSSTTIITGVAEQAKYAVEAGKAQKASYADLADKANTANKAARSDYASVAGALDENSEVYGQFIRKDQDDETNYWVTFLKGIKLGPDGKWYIDQNGKAKLNELLVNLIESGEIRTEYLTVTKAAHFFKLIVDEMKSTSGTIINTAANCVLDKVQAYDAGGNLLSVDEDGKVTDTDSNGDTIKISYWRCYWKAKDGDDKAITNQWVEDDQAIVYTCNLAEGTTYNASNNYWWRLVERVSEEPVETVIDGEIYECHYIDISNTTYDSGEFTQIESGYPAVGDNVAQLGNRTDKERQGAIIFAAYNTPDTEIVSPSFCQYVGITDFDLSSHRYTWFARNGNKIRGNFEVSAGMGVQSYIHYAYSDSLTYSEDLVWVKGSMGGKKWKYRGMVATTSSDDEDLAFNDYSWEEIIFSPVYSAELTTYSDNVVIDAEGNVIGGLWKETSSGGRQYIISSALIVKKNGSPLRETESDTAGDGEYKVMGVAPLNCSYTYSHGTFFITGIDNCHDGVSETTDEIDYEVMRLMHRCELKITVAIEGEEETRIVTMPVAISHYNEAYITTELDNDTALTTYNTKKKMWIGLDECVTVVKKRHGTDYLKLTGLNIKDCTDWTDTYDSDGNLSYSTCSYGGMKLKVTLSTGTIEVMQMLSTSPRTTNVTIISTCAYAGISYESEKVWTVTVRNGVDMYDIHVNTQFVTFSHDDSGNLVPDYDTVTCNAYYVSDDETHKDITSSLSTYNVKIYHSVDGGTKTEGNSVTPTTGMGTITFHLIDTDGYEWDKEDVSVIVEATSVTGSEVSYQLGENDTDVPSDESGWVIPDATTSIPERTYEKPFLWTRTRIYYNDGSWQDTYTVSGRMGEDGHTSFTSIVFKRSATQPDAPTAGGYDSPTPTSEGWSDGIPDEDGTPCWMSSRAFSTDPDFVSTWSTPQKVADTADLDICFNASEDEPTLLPLHHGAQTDENDNGWHDTATSADIWMAVAKCSNGKWGDWEVSKIKGEKGDQGTSFTWNLLTKEQRNITNWTLLNTTYMTVANDGETNTFSLSKTEGGWERAFIPITLTVGKQYTLSCKYSVGMAYTLLNSYDFGLEIAIHALDNETGDGNMCIIPFLLSACSEQSGSVTFTATQSAGYLGLNGGHIADGLTDLTFTISDIKLEEGDEASGWTPHPDDLIGENVMRLDLDNENDAMLYDGAGTLVSGSVTSQATLYDGATAVSASNVTWGVTNSGCTATVSSSGKVTVTALSATTATVTVKATYNGATYTAVMSLKKLVGVDKYDLVLSANSVSVDVNNGNALSPTSITVGVYRTAQNGTRSLQTSLTSGYSLKYTPNGGSETTLSYGSGKAVIYPSASVTSYTVTLYDANSKVLDFETIPVVKDGTNGTNGKDGWTFHITPETYEINDYTDINNEAMPDVTDVVFTVYATHGGSTKICPTSVATTGTPVNCTAVTTSTGVQIASVLKKTYSYTDSNNSTQYVEMYADSGSVDFIATFEDGGETIEHQFTAVFKCSVGSKYAKFTVDINGITSEVTDMTARTDDLEATIEGCYSTIEQTADEINSAVATVEDSVETMRSEFTQTSEEIKVSVQAIKDDYVTQAVLDTKADSITAEITSSLEKTGIYITDGSVNVNAANFKVSYGDLEIISTDSEGNTYLGSDDGTRITISADGKVSFNISGITYNLTDGNGNTTSVTLAETMATWKYDTTSKYITPLANVQMGDSYSFVDHLAITQLSGGDAPYILIGGIRIEYDSDNNALKVVGSDGSTSANFYATGGVSARGIGSVSTGGGSGSVSIMTTWGQTTEDTWALSASLGQELHDAISLLQGGTIGSGDVGGATQFMYMSSGKLTATTASVGSSVNPVYLNNGIVTACNVYTKSAVGDCGWSTYANYLIAGSALAYWDGAYTGTASNLKYSANGTILGSGNYSSYITASYVNGLGVNAATATTCTGNASTATALKNSRTLWGQSFDGSANVSGNMTGVGSITATGAITTAGGRSSLPTLSCGYTNTSYALSANSFICNSWVRTKGSTGWYNEDYGGGWYMTDSTWIRSYGSKNVYINAGLCTSGSVGIGTTSASHTLHVVGDTYSSGSITTAGQLISTVSTDMPVKVSSTTLCSNLNADMLDGVHAAGLLTGFSCTRYGTYATYAVTVGGITKSASLYGADASYAGLVTTAAQTFAGTKTFNNNVGVLGNLGVGTTGSSYTLHVTGSTYLATYLGVATAPGKVSGVRVDVAGDIRSTTVTGLGQFRAAYNSYPEFIIRNDGSNTYFLLTDSGTHTSFNALRPFYVNNTSGLVTMNNCLYLPENTTDSTTDNPILNFIQIGSARLYYDSTNNALFVKTSSGGACNFYATGGVSAKGYMASLTVSKTGTDLTLTGALSVAGKTTIGSSSYIYESGSDLYILNDNSIYLGNSDLSNYVYCADLCSYSGTTKWYINTAGYARMSRLGIGGAPSSSYVLYVAGTVSCTSLTQTSSSDLRLKDIMPTKADYTERLLSLGDVFDYRFNEVATALDGERYDGNEHTGLAWQRVKEAMPTITGIDENGYGYINYLSSDLVGLTIGALQQNIKKTMSNEERIKHLEEENMKLRERINVLEKGGNV